MSDGPIDYVESVRPTRQRLLAAMGVSACSIAVLLTLLGPLVDSVTRFSTPGIESSLYLDVFVGRGEPEPGIATDDQAIPEEKPIPVDNADLPQNVVTASSSEQPAVKESVRDWHTIAEEAAIATVDEHFTNEEFRASMWQQSRTIMLQPASALVATEEEPYLAGFRFTPRIHVVGLGITIGSCFIGVPLAGVPVEQRTVAITLFVCAEESG